MKLKLIYSSVFNDLRVGWMVPSELAHKLQKNTLTIARYVSEVDPELVKTMYRKSKVTGDYEKSIFWPGIQKYTLLFLEKEFNKIRQEIKEKEEKKNQ